MPLGFQHRTLYYQGPVCRWETGVGSTNAYNGTSTPARGFEQVYTYRSGKRSKDLNQQGSYSASVGSGDLGQRLLKRKLYLEHAIKSITESGRPGNVNVFSGTDTGHPFASHKVWSTSIPVTIGFKYPSEPLRTWIALVGCNEYPLPNVNDPFGTSYTSGTAIARYSDFAWQATPWSDTVASNQRINTQALRSALGTRLIASTNPWSPKADLAQTVLELWRGDIPTVVKNLREYMLRIQSLKKTLGSDWLNIQFGWTPLINDIKATVEVLFKLHTLLYTSTDSRRYRSGDLGVWSRSREGVSLTPVYRSSPLLPGITGSPYVGRSTGVAPYNAADWNMNIVRTSASTLVKADYRFSARFHRGATASSRELGYIERAAELLGMESTPSTLWELTPWTWLLDWASNLGSVAENLSRLDWSNVLLDYSYLTLMVESTHTASVTFNRSYSSSQWTNTVDRQFAGTTTKATEKIREQASPYGFSVSWNGLSAYQLSILAALGMSRGR